MKKTNKYLILFILLISACRQDVPDSGPKYSKATRSTGPEIISFAVHPLHNPALLIKAYQPMIDYMNVRIPDARLELEASRDYPSYEIKYREGKPGFILPNPWQTTEALSFGYEVISMAGDPEDFKGIFIVRKDSSIRTPEDLMGLTVSYPAETALAACVMPQYFLHSHGIDINKDIKNIYVGSQESSIMNAYVGTSAAGATCPPPWRAFQKAYPKEAADLKIAWETPPLINNSVMVRKNLPAVLKQKVSDALAELHLTDEGRAILSGMETSRFYKATDRDYDVVKDFVARFEKDVRPVRSK